MDRLTFHDVLQAANPLQYVPVVGSLYRIATGDSPPAGVRSGISAVLGVLTGGPIGLLGSIIGSLLEHALHVEDHVRAAVTAPAVTAPAATVADPEKAGRAAAAYRTAGLLGSV